LLIQFFGRKNKNISSKKINENTFLRMQMPTSPLAGNQKILFTGELFCPIGSIVMISYSSIAIYKLFILIYFVIAVATKFK
jgi:hypothetical protein